MLCQECREVEVIDSRSGICKVCCALHGVESEVCCIECGYPVREPAIEIKGKPYCRVCAALYEAPMLPRGILGLWAGYARPIEPPEFKGE